MNFPEACQLPTLKHFMRMIWWSPIAVQGAVMWNFLLYKILDSGALQLVFLAYASLLVSHPVLFVDFNVLLGLAFKHRTIATIREHILSCYLQEQL
jgi:hypothetical protein